MLLCKTIRIFAAIIVNLKNQNNMFIYFLTILVPAIIGIIMAYSWLKRPRV